jgi:hypothetical protein
MDCSIQIGQVHVVYRIRWRSDGWSCLNRNLENWSILKLQDVKVSILTGIIDINMWNYNNPPSVKSASQFAFLIEFQKLGQIRWNSLYVMVSGTVYQTSPDNIQSENRLKYTIFLLKSFKPDNYKKLYNCQVKTYRYLFWKKHSYS